MGEMALIREAGAPRDLRQGEITVMLQELLRPFAARKLVKALRDAVSLPIHLHTHDTPGVQAASLASTTVYVPAGAGSAPTF